MSDNKLNHAHNEYNRIPAARIDAGGLGNGHEVNTKPHEKEDKIRDWILKECIPNSSITLPDANKPEYIVVLYSKWKNMHADFSRWQNDVNEVTPQHFSRTLRNHFPNMYLASTKGVTEFPRCNECTAHSLRLLNGGWNSDAEKAAACAQSAAHKRLALQERDGQDLQLQLARSSGSTCVVIGVDDAT